MKTQKTQKTNGKRILSLVVCAVIACAALVTAAFAIVTANETEPTLDVYATNLSFSDSIYIKYAIAYNNVDKAEDIKLLVWTAPDDKYEFGTQNEIIESPTLRNLGNTACAVFDYTGIAAKNMTDYVYTRAYYEKDGNVYYSEVKKYSVLTYVYNKLGYTGTATTNESLRALLVGLLEYGASAQDYFDYKTDALANTKHVLVTIENGTFEDGFNTTLAVPGAKLKVKAPATNKDGSFAYWVDERGNLISALQKSEITLPDDVTEPFTFSAHYITNGGGDIEGVGPNLGEDSFVLNHKYDESKAIDKSAAELEAILSSLEEGAVYRVTGDELNITEAIDGNKATIIAPAGVKVSANIENIVIIGNVSVEADNITINNSRIVAEGEAAITSECANTSITNSYVSGNVGVASTANGLTVYSTFIETTETGVNTSGEDIAVNNNFIHTNSNANGIIIGENSLNSLVTFNRIVGSLDAIKINGATNTVVLFNSAYNVAANNNTNTYIVENSFGGKIKLTDNNYLLCDENACAEEPEVSGNDNVNGNNLMDVDARNDVGAKEELLPHTNKDLFLLMDRKETVKDIANGTSYDLNEYVEQNAKTNGIVIVPPGAYKTAAGDLMKIDSSMSNTDIYAFGVYNEHGFLTDAEYLADTSKNNYILSVDGASNVSIHGIWNAYDYQSSGQAHVLEKLGDNQFRVIPAAGYDLEAGFGLTNTGIFSSNAYVFKSGELAPWIEIAYKLVSKEENGTIIVELYPEGMNHSEEIEAALYENINPGDVFACRMAGDNQRTISITNAPNALFKDCIVTGYAAALSHVVAGSSTNAWLERVHNCAKSPYVIDEATYNKYLTFEKQYDVDLEISFDENLKCYRGSIPRFGSVDATHVTGANKGLNIVSCLFENSCDDGSNQRGSSSRLAAIKDNGDGTTTIYIKGMVTQVYHNMAYNAGDKTKNLTPGTYLAGDNIYVYTSAGKVVCDTECLTNSRDVDSMFQNYILSGITYNIYVKSVTVPTKDVNFEALEGYDLNDNHYDLKHKVMVDNISRASAGFTADNLMVRDSHARGILAKTVNVDIKNCTFKNIKGTGVLLNCEPEWGESTISRNITITDCLFDYTGFSSNTWSVPKNAPIYASGLYTYGKADIDTILSSNISIDGCEFKNYGHDYGIYLEGVKDVKITNNVFDPLDSADPGHFVGIKTAINVEISGNEYRNSNGESTLIKNIAEDKKFTAEDIVNVYGTDVGDKYKKEYNININDSHIAEYKIVPADKSNYDIAEILSDGISKNLGYSIAATPMSYEKMIQLVVDDAANGLIGTQQYTVECKDGNLIITAPTRAALAYAVEAFAADLSNTLQSEKTINYDDGYSDTFSFAVNNFSALSDDLFKYTGVWTTKNNAKVSGADADYIEFNFEGTTITLLFDGEATFSISFDGVHYEEYTATGEKTFVLPKGAYNVRLLCTDDSKPIRFLGVKSYSSEPDAADNKEQYIQFIGDSVVDDAEGFAHAVGDLLNWDYSVIATNGSELPATDVNRIPDIVVISLGTDDITAGADISAFTSKYYGLVSNIYDRYGDNTAILALQALSPADDEDTIARNTVINEVATNIENMYPGLLELITSEEIQSWNIEYDASGAFTNVGNYNLLVGLSGYIIDKSDVGNYINHVFDLNNSGKYPSSTEKSDKLHDENEDIDYYRFKFQQNGHVFVNGNDYANTVVIDSGKYLVIKYRASGDHSIDLNLRTNDIGADEAGTNYVSTVKKPDIYVPTDWELAVVDLSQFKNYTTDKNIGVQVRITTTSSELDIAYVAIVDNISEANRVAMFELGDTFYKLYEDWSLPGEYVSLDGEPIPGDPTTDLAFVNHIFNVNVMSTYQGSVTHNQKDGKVSYSRFEFTNVDKNGAPVTGHVFIKGTSGSNNNDSTLTGSIDGSTGNYMVIKYRANNDDQLRLQMQTDHITVTPTGNSLSSIEKPSTLVSTEWEVAVIDLSQFPNYKRDTEGLRVRIRFTTHCDFVDIAYAALVDNIEEAEAFIYYLGDSEYVKYDENSNWASAGTEQTINK